MTSLVKRPVTCSHQFKLKRRNKKENARNVKRKNYESNSKRLPSVTTSPFKKLSSVFKLKRSSKKIKKN